MLKPVFPTCGRCILLMCLLAASPATALDDDSTALLLAETGQVDLRLRPREFADIKAFNDMVVILQAGGLPDGTMNVVNLHFSAPTEGFAMGFSFVSIDCYDPRARGEPINIGRGFEAHAIPVGESNEAGLFCPRNMKLLSAEAFVSLISP